MARFKFYMHDQSEVCLVMLLKCLALYRNQMMNFLDVNFNGFDIYFFCIFYEKYIKVLVKLG